MNLITHLVKTDIRHSRVLLVVWLLLLALQSLPAVSGLMPGDRGSQVGFAMIAQFTPELEILLLFVLVPFVVQADPLAGTTAFWLTRPISRPTLLASKAVFVAVAILLPAVLVEVIVFSTNGMTLRDTALVVPEVILIWLTPIVTVAVLAAVTPNFGRYAIAGVALVVAILAVELVMSWMQRYYTSASRTVAVSLWVIVGGGMVVAHQYLTRRTIRTVVAGAVVAAAVLPVQILWAWDFLAPALPKSPPPFDASAVKIELNGDIYVQEIITASGEGAPDKQIYGNIDAAGLPGSYTVRAERIRPHLRLADGAALPVKEVTGMPLMIQMHAEALESALGGIPVVNAAPLNYSTGLFIVDADTYSKYGDQPLTFTADLNCLASKYSIGAEMAMAREARFDRGSHHLVIAGVLRQSDGVDLMVRERAPNLLFDRANRFAARRDYINLGPGYQSAYVLLNKKRNEAVLQKSAYSDSFTPFGASRLVNRLLRVSFGPEPQHNRLTPSLNDAWLADAELVRLDLVPVAEFPTQLVVEKMTLNGRNGFKAMNTVDFANVRVEAR